LTTREEIRGGKGQKGVQEELGETVKSKIAVMNREREFNCRRGGKKKLSRNTLKVKGEGEGVG